MIVIAVTCFKSSPPFGFLGIWSNVRPNSNLSGFPLSSASSRSAIGSKLLASPMLRQSYTYSLYGKTYVFQNVSYFPVQLSSITRIHIIDKIVKYLHNVKFSKFDEFFRYLRDLLIDLHKYCILLKIIFKLFFGGLS